MKGRYLLKGVMRLMSADKHLMYKMLFWILEELAEGTETEVDNSIIDLLEDILGYKEDTADLRDL